MEAMNAPRRSSRRDFLKGRAAADRLLDLTQGEATSTPDGPALPQSAQPSGYLLQLSRRAMACQFEIQFDGKQYPEGTEAAVAALDLVDALEDQLSVYRDHTEVTELNRRAAHEAVTVEPGLFALFQQSVELFETTGGAFDITSGPLSKAWGFFRRAGKLPSEEQIAEALGKVGSQFLALDAEQRSVRFRHPELEINFNSIGKGYAVDRAADLLWEAGIGDFLFHGGQSSVVARGAPPSTPEQGWTVGLRHPLRPEQRIAEFSLRDEALGTSGSGTQFFHHQGRRYGHVLDPRTGYPAVGVYSSTVLAPTAAEADALATALYVLGPHEARRYCEARPSLAMVLVCPGERAGELAVVQQGLDEHRFRLLG